MLIRSGLALLLAAALGCGAEDTVEHGVTAFEAQYGTVVIEIDYQEGAEPRVWDAVGKPDPYLLFEENLDTLFRLIEDRTVEVPRKLTDMEKLAAPTADTLSLDELKALVDAHRDTAHTDDTRAFYFIFLAQRLEHEGVVRDDLLGLALSEQGAVAIFRPNIDAVANPQSKKYFHVFMEQSTMVHEFGHVVGFVNNGLPMTSEHHDAEHGAHCTNPDCVMYYASEGVDDLAAFVQQLQESSGERTTLFGIECLADAYVATGGDKKQAPKTPPKPNLKNKPRFPPRP